MEDYASYFKGNIDNNMDWLKEKQTQWIKVFIDKKDKSKEVQKIKYEIIKSNSDVRSFFNRTLIDMQTALKCRTTLRSELQKLNIDDLKQQKSEKEESISGYVNSLKKLFNDDKTNFEKCETTEQFEKFLEKLMFHEVYRNSIISNLTKLYEKLKEIYVNLSEKEVLAAERDTCLGKCRYYSETPSKWTHKSLKEHRVFFPAPVMLSFKGFHNIQDQIDENKQSEELKELFSSKKPGHFEEKEQPTELKKLEKLSRKFINAVKDAQTDFCYEKSAIYEAEVRSYLAECFDKEMMHDYGPESKLETTYYKQAQMLPPATPSTRKRKRDNTSESAESSDSSRGSASSKSSKSAASSESSVEGGGLPKSDGCMKSTNGNYILHLEVKTLLSDKIDQLFGYYAIYTAEKKEECPNNPFPALLVFMNGNILSVYGAIFTHCISISPVIQPIDLFHKNAVRDLIATMKTLKDVLKELEDYYKKEADYIDWSDHIFNDPNITAKITNPKTKEDFMKRDRALPIFWECKFTDEENKEKDAIIKFTSHYNKEAHEALANEQFAPKLYHYEENHIYCVVVYEKFPGKSLKEVPEVKEERWFQDKLLKIVNALRQKRLVFADLRENNILINGEEVKLIDFDWAGRAGIDVYVASPNEKIDWHTNVKRGAPLQLEHDKKMLEKLIGKTKIGDDNKLDKS